MADPNKPSPRPATRPEHSEAYWQSMKYLILGLGGLMIIALGLAIIIIFRVIPW